MRSQGLLLSLLQNPNLAMRSSLRHSFARSLQPLSLFEYRGDVGTVSKQSVSPAHSTGTKPQGYLFWFYINPFDLY